MLATIFNELYRLNRELNSIIRDNDTMFYTAWPQTNIYENEDEYMVSARLPGANKDDLQITIKDNSLKISGKIKKDKGEKDSVHLAERKYGDFERNFILNDRVEFGKIEAEFQNGILLIRIPKAAEVKPMKINVK